MAFAVVRQEAADASLNEVRSIWAILSRLLYGVPKVENFDNVETLEDWGVSPHTTREILAGGSSGLDPRFIGRWMRRRLWWRDVSEAPE